VICSGAFDQDPRMRFKKGEAHLDRVRVPTRVVGEARRWLAPAMLRWVLDDGEATTGFRMTRRPRSFDRRP
jgi:hypothetical protein